MFRFIKQEAGYTMLESLFHLVIMITFLHLFVLLFFWKLSIDRQFGTNSAMEWELFSAEMQNLLEKVEMIEVSGDGRILRLVNERGLITLGLSGTVLRKSVDIKGHIPLYTDVQSVEFAFDGTMLLTQATMRNGESRERRFAVGIYPE